MIAPLSNKEWEIEKFCAKGMNTGTGAGSACLKACIDYAKEKQVEKIVFIQVKNANMRFTCIRRTVLRRSRTI